MTGDGELGLRVSRSHRAEGSDASEASVLPDPSA
jgi:hypothetical protein